MPSNSIASPRDRHEPEDRPRRRRLAAARFADERQGLAATDREGDAPDRLDAGCRSSGDPVAHAPPPVERHVEVVHAQERGRGRRLRVPSGA